MSFDPIALLEKAYQFQPDQHAWLNALATDVVPALGEDWIGGAAYLAEHPAPPTHFVPVCREGSPIDADMNLRFARAASGAVSALREPGIASLTEMMGTALWTHGGDGRVAVFSNFSMRRARLDTHVRRLWQRIAIHLGFGCRLAGRRMDPEATDVEAVITEDSRVAHAEGLAEGQDAQRLLCSAAAEMDRARSRAGRADPLGALELWRGLIAGRWSLVEHFDADGRRYILARRNDEAAQSLAQSRRQQQVTFYASVGWSNQEIGYELGLAPNTVSAHLTRGPETRGIRSRAELVRLSADVAVASNVDSSWNTMSSSCR